MAAANPGGGFLPVLRNRNFLYLWLAQIISQMIFNAANYAFLVLINKVSQSTTLVGLAIISFVLPAVLFGAPAGVVVDHVSRRRILWGSNCLRGIATLLMIVVLIVDHTSIVPLYILTFIISTIGQFFAPAESSSIPQLVRKSELMPALSLFNITMQISQAIGYVVASIVLTLLPEFHLFNLTIDAFVQLYFLIGILYLLCAGLILLIPQNQVDRKYTTQSGQITTQTLGAVGSIWHEMYQGWQFVRTNKPLFLAVIQLSYAGVLLFVVIELATKITTNLLHLPENALVLVFAPAALGVVVGSLLTPGIFRKLGHSRTITTGTIILTIACALVPLSAWLSPYLKPAGWSFNPLVFSLIALLLLAAGFGLDFLNIPSQTAMQELTPNRLKGRVISLQLVLYSACTVPVILFMGGFADAFGIENVLYLLAVCHILFGAWSLYYEKKHATAIQAYHQRQGMEQEKQVITLEQKRIH
ncbi:MFS transporter [Thermosporothrix hazakensis]|jgi:MFS family permease|uniref:MFS transporter n=1 Tax=Thermosporothrix hazakensis TaxID=644383 RepID=A0A326UER2_THEHA|nr:MFS transporter [Thermosporothrix hazakensis]PZW36351.1 MFS transporter [Thermosporothrix hazakensis]GCE47000.1 MFS transporter [Thermosporothrix hazakensis]